MRFLFKLERSSLNIHHYPALTLAGVCCGPIILLSYLGADKDAESDEFGYQFKPGHFAG